MGTRFNISLRCVKKHAQMTFEEDNVGNIAGRHFPLFPINFAKSSRGFRLGMYLIISLARPSRPVYLEFLLEQVSHTQWGSSGAQFVA